MKWCERKQVRTKRKRHMRKAVGRADSIVFKCIPTPKATQSQLPCSWTWASWHSKAILPVSVMGKPQDGMSSCCRHTRKLQHWPEMGCLALGQEHEPCSSRGRGWLGRGRRNHLRESSLWIDGWSRKPWRFLQTLKFYNCINRSHGKSINPYMRNKHPKKQNEKKKPIPSSPNIAEYG